MRLNVLHETVQRRHSELQPTYYPSFDVNVRALEADLKRHVGGEVRFDDASKAIYSTDASNYRFIPVGVVVPREIDDLQAAMSICHRHGAPVTPRGGGTSLAGQCCNFAVVIDTSKYLTRILDIDYDNQTAHVQNGVILDQLNNQTKPRGWAYGPDPATHEYCTFGGMLGNNACGVHALAAGRTSDNVLEMNVITGDGEVMHVGPTDEPTLERCIQEGGRRGEIYRGLKEIRDRYGDLIRHRYPDIPRRVSGYNLDDLLPERGMNVARSLVGTEGTCVMVADARVRLVPWPQHRSLLVLGYADIQAAASAVPRIVESGPHACEAIDDRLVGFMRLKEMKLQDVALLPEGRAWLLVEFGGDNEQEADDEARALIQRLESTDARPVSSKLMEDVSQAGKIWEIRESGLGATAHVPGMEETWPGWEDSAVHPNDLGAYVGDLLKLFTKYDYNPAVYGHFGQACVHCRVPFDLRTALGIEKYKAFLHEASDLVRDYRGSLSGEHGDGQSRAAFLPKLYGPELMDAMRKFKRLWDPDWRMNPGKVIDPLPVDADLRLGTSFQPLQPETHYSYPVDDHSFIQSSLRCVGIGKCRRREDAFMCPSFIVTHEELHTTRGRARALFEMVHGGFLDTGWKSEAVRESLDLCLGCKGCKRECPVEVDMATYKSEFLSHHYRGRLRPREHYAMGYIHQWAHLAACWPRAANYFGQTRPFDAALKWIAGVSQQRKLPRFARQTFTDWFRRRSKHPNRTGEPVMLYPDTFHDYFVPNTLKAAVQVLEHHGFNVRIPERRQPGLRPLLHYGFLDSAKKHLRRVISDLRDHAAAGHPIVAVEPSTVSAFRDEMANLLPDDEDGKRVRLNTSLFTEFLFDRELPMPHIGGKALVHQHCHEKAVLNPDAAVELLKQAGVEPSLPEAGCCGMAGAFGYEAEHYEVSMKVGEHQLFPAVRRLDSDQRVVVTGFSCREHIEHGTGRRPLHFTELLQQAIDR